MSFLYKIPLALELWSIVKSNCKLMSIGVLTRYYMEYSKKVGEKIRILRKKCGYTLIDFAKLLNKSKSVVSKYERGEIAIDILTIRQIAQVLNIPVSSLLEDELPQIAPLFSTADNIDFSNLSSIKTIYVYSYFAHAGKPILRVQQIQCVNEKAISYLYPEHNADGKSFECIYTGTVINESSFTRIMISNPVVPNDVVILDFPARFQKGKPVLGYITSISIPPYSPLASAAILSDTPIADADWLKAKLTLDKDVTKYIKKNNCFMLPLDSNYKLNKD